jgi:hypothetical protein
MVIVCGYGPTVCHGTPAIPMKKYSQQQMIRRSSQAIQTKAKLSHNGLLRDLFRLGEFFLGQIMFGVNVWQLVICLILESSFAPDV